MGKEETDPEFISRLISKTEKKNTSQQLIMLDRQLANIRSISTNTSIQVNAIYNSSVVNERKNINKTLDMNESG